MATTTVYLSSHLGTGTNPDSLNYGVPINTYYYQNRSQGIILASELTSMGLQSGDKFTRFGYYATEAGGRSTIANFRIGLALTSNTTVTSWYNWTNFTLVYGPTNITMSSFPLNTYSYVDLTDQTFEWNGTSNLIIDMSRTDTGYSGTSGLVRTATGVGSNRTYAGRADSSTFPYTGSGTAYAVLMDYYFQVTRPDAAPDENCIFFGMNF